jgi:membrane dipeptidase
VISPTKPIFDAHLDLAYLAELGRDMSVPLDQAADPHPPAAVTLPELQRAGVTACLGTIFLEATDTPSRGEEQVCYPPGDANEAYFKGVNQLNHYHLWKKEGFIRFFNDPEDEPLPASSSSSAGPINVGILIECADPIIEPHHLSFWSGRGVVAISLSWAVESRYAGGNSTNVGLTDLGRKLIEEMARLNIVLDLSHLSQRATYDALDFTDVRICATHSNCRSLLGDQNNPAWQRHLDDDTIKTIASRKGIIGLNLFKQFIQWPLAETDRPSIAKAVDHIDHICQLTGSAQHVGIGSDLDGGFGACDLPIGINRAADMRVVLDELSNRNYSDTEIRNIAHDNWAEFFSLGQS